MCAPRIGGTALSGGHGRGRPATRAFGRAAVYRLLAEGLSYPTPEGIALLRGPYLAAARAAAPVLDPVALAGLAALDHALTTLDQASAERAHVAAFGHAGLPAAVPYEAPYLTTNVFQETATLADVTGFYGAFGVEPSAARRERADHVSLELEFMHLLAFKEGYARRHHGAEAVAICVEAQRAFLAAHLGRWGPLFFRRLRETAPGTHYEALAAVGEPFLAAEAASAGARPVGATRLSPPPAAEDEADACPLAPGVFA